MEKIRGVLEGIYKNKELRRTIVPLFMGDPGTGKTQVINEFVRFAKENKVNFVDFFNTSDIDPKSVQYIGSQISPFEISGVGMPNKETKRLVYYNYDKLASLKDGDVLFFDELPNTNPSTLNGLLTLIEDRVMLSGDKLPDVMIVAAGNYQGMSPMTPQIKRRFVWYDVKFNSKMWKDFMANKYSMPSTISNKLCNLIKTEDFSGYNFNTGADLDKAVNMIINNVYTPYKNTIEPILNTLVENKLNRVLKLTENKELAVGESIKWLDLIRLDKNIILEEPKEEPKQNENGILILDNNDNIIGGIKDVEILKSIYHISTEMECKLNEGDKIPIDWSFLGLLFFSKKNKY